MKYWVVQVDNRGQERQGVYCDVDYATYVKDRTNVLAVYKGEQDQVDLLLLLKDGNISPVIKKTEMERTLNQMERIK